MVNSDLSYYPTFSSLDLYYVSVASNIFLFGYIVVMTIGFTGNICQILTFSRKTMRNISTGVLFLALSISDTIYLLLAMYTLIIYGFQVSDASDYAKTCRFRHYFIYLSTNFSSWMLTIIACERWIRSQFPTQSQRICTPRIALKAIVIILLFYSILNSHLITPMFGQIAPGVRTNCGADIRYPNYVYFFYSYWPVISILTVTIIPASCMLFFLTAITLTVRNHRNRVIPNRQRDINQQATRRARFLQRQMLILMIITLTLFFLTTFPVALLRFVLSTLKIQQSFSFNLLMISIFDLITLLNYSLNFYFHCLTSKLFRKQFLKLIPCALSISCHMLRRNTTIVNTQHELSNRPPGPYA